MFATAALACCCATVASMGSGWPFPCIGLRRVADDEDLRVTRQLQGLFGDDLPGRCLLDSQLTCQVGRRARLPSKGASGSRFACRRPA